MSKGATEFDQTTLAVSFDDRSEEAHHGWEVPEPHSVDSLTLTRERKQKPVNLFLDEYHGLGGVPGWKAAFGATYAGYLVAVCVLGRPANPQVDDGDTIYIDRLAARPDRPANTGSWLIARARKWAALEGYDTLVALAGIGDNTGTVYAAAGFECENYDDPETVSGDGWDYRPDRKTYDSYEKRRWVCDLKPYRQ